MPFSAEAIARLKEQGFDVHLTLVGDGPLHRGLQQQAEAFGVANHICFAGWKSQQELRDLYNESDACVLASFAEDVPVVLMEAMAAGVPCIAPRITGIPELIREGVDGLLFTPSSVDELAMVIAEMSTDSNRRRTMAYLSRERVARKYDLSTNMRVCRKSFGTGCFLIQGG